MTPKRARPKWMQRHEIYACSSSQPPHFIPDTPRALVAAGIVRAYLRIITVLVFPGLFAGPLWQVRKPVAPGETFVERRWGQLGRKLKHDILRDHARALHVAGKANFKRDVEE